MTYQINLPKSVNQSDPNLICNVSMLALCTQVTPSMYCFILFKATPRTFLLLANWLQFEFSASNANVNLNKSHILNC